MKDIETLCSTLWKLVKHHQGESEYYYDARYTLKVDKVDEILTVFDKETKIIGYNSERGVTNWYGDEEDFNRLWEVISNHDETFGFEWHLR